MARRRFSVGWLLVSYLLVCGGFSVTAAFVQPLGSTDEWVMYGVFFVGAALGGFVAGRASPGRAIAEPAVAGALLVASFFALFFLSSRMRDVVDAGEAVKRALAFGFVTGLGGLVGAVFAERSARARRSTSGWFWMVVSGLLMLGVFVASVVALSFASDNWFDGMGVGTQFGLLVLSAFLSGLIAQAIAPCQMRGPCAAGTVVVAIAGMTLGIANGADEIAALVGGLVIISLIGTLAGAAGAAVGWALCGRRIEREQELAGDGELPAARVR